MARKRLLLIDDEEDFCALAKKTLETIGEFDIVIATSGKDGIKAAKKERPDLILLDIRMPGTDGFQVLDALKKEKTTMGIPVIMLSALHDEETKCKATQSLDEAYITKPIEAEDLKAKIDEVFKRRGIA